MKTEVINIMGKPYTREVFLDQIGSLYRLNKNTGEVDEFNPFNCRGWVKISDSDLVTYIDASIMEKAEANTKKLRDYYNKINKNKLNTSEVGIDVSKIIWDTPKIKD